MLLWRLYERDVFINPAQKSALKFANFADSAYRRVAEQFPGMQNICDCKFYELILVTQKRQNDHIIDKCLQLVVL